MSSGLFDAVSDVVAAVVSAVVAVVVVSVAVAVAVAVGDRLLPSLSLNNHFFRFGAKYRSLDDSKSFLAKFLVTILIFALFNSLPTSVFLL